MICLVCNGRRKFNDEFDSVCSTCGGLICKICYRQLVLNNRRDVIDKTQKQHNHLEHGSIDIL